MWTKIFLEEFLFPAISYMNRKNSPPLAQTVTEQMAHKRKMAGWHQKIPRRNCKKEPTHIISIIILLENYAYEILYRRLLQYTTIT